MTNLTRARIRSIWLLALSVIISAALLIQLGYGLYKAPHMLAYIEQFFSFFTIWSNIFVAVILLISAFTLWQGKEASRAFDSARGAAVFCILTTGVVYTLFLRGPGGQNQLDYSLPLLNSIFHYIIPTLIVVDWIIIPPRSRMNWSTVFSWLGLTIIYLAVVELAGLLTHEYPYFFLNPVMFRGYTGVLMASAIFLPFFIVFSLFVIATANVQQRFRKYASRIGA